MTALVKALLSYVDGSGNIQPLASDSSGNFNISNVESSSTSALTNVSGSASTGTLLAANTSRKKAVIVNDSSATLYVLYGAGTASATNYTVRLYPNDTLIEENFNGILVGIWSSATGTARVTEMT